jgi:RNA polymerase sigma-70 factor (ECF subfamily)
VRVLVNIRRDAWRKAEVRSRYEETVRRADSIASDQESALIARATVWRALDTLAPRRRAVVVMRELEGLPIASIASLLGISAITVRWHLSVGRRELARFLESHGGRHDHR